MPHLKAHFESFLIALGLIGVSLLVGWYLVGKPFQEYIRIGQWERVPVVLSSVELKEHTDNTSLTTSYDCQASYHYSYKGQTYKASNVSIYKGSDNLSSYHQQLYQELSRHQQSGTTFPAYVNPSNPDEAVLTREIRWGVTLGVSCLVLLFCAAGVFMIFKTAKEQFAKN